ncbi:MAG: hypothetical protein ACFFEF_10830 [Candidatus Thorarchaeota archaeon]
MAEAEFPTWIRLIDIIVGIISVLAAVLIIIGSTLSHLVVIFVLSISIMAIGIARAARAAAVKAKGVPRRLVNITTGSVAIVISLFLLIATGLAEPLMIQLVALAWLVLGLARLAIGVLEKDVDRRLRMSQFLIGGVSVIVAIVISIYPEVNTTLALALLGVIVGMNGMARVARGYVGV